MLINIKDIKGEETTGFEPRVVNGVDKGPFACHNCYFFKDDSCGQKDMIAKGKKVGDLRPDGRRPVKDEDCCEFIDRVGHKVDIMKSATWLKK